MTTGTNERLGRPTAALGVLAVLAAVGFGVLTWLIATGVVYPFDQHLLHQANALTDLTPT